MEVKIEGTKRQFKERTVKKQVKGRTLAEFTKEQPLSKAEGQLLENCAKGNVTDIGIERPAESSSENSIRAGLIRLLALGSDKQNAPLHEHGVRVKGAWIEGDIDLENCEVPVELDLSSCIINGTLVLRDANLFFLGLAGSAVGKISADRLRCTGIVILDAGFHAKETVSLNGAHIGGSIYCNDGIFEGGKDGALLLSGAEINGSVFMGKEIPKPGEKEKEGFHATGLVNLYRARVGGNLNCQGGHFNGAGDTALYCERIDVGGSVDLSGGFLATGEVSFVGADIGFSLICDGGQFDGAGRAALSCDAAKVGGYAFLRNGFQATGEVSFLGGNIGLNLECTNGKFKGHAGVALLCRGGRSAAVST